MFMLGKQAVPLAPGDIITINLAVMTRTVEVRRGKDTLLWVPTGEDCWPYFCQLIKSPEDAQGVASALAGAVGHAIKRLDDARYEVVAFVPKKEKKK